MQCPNLGRTAEKYNPPKFCRLSKTAINILMYFILLSLAIFILPYITLQGISIKYWNLTSSCGFVSWAVRPESGLFGRKQKTTDATLHFHQLLEPLK